MPISPRTFLAAGASGQNLAAFVQPGFLPGTAELYSLTERSRPASLHAFRLDSAARTSLDRDQRGSLVTLKGAVNRSHRHLNFCWRTGRTNLGERQTIGATISDEPSRLCGAAAHPPPLSKL
jgi:hypothetical protein